MSSGSLRSRTVTALRAALALRPASEQVKAILEKRSGKLAGATITIGAEATNVRAITIQLTDEEGNALDHVAHVRAVLFADAAGAALATTGGSTGIEIGTDGAIVDTAVAKKVFDLVSEPDGDIDLTWTDTGTEEVFLALVMPQGNLVFSTSIQNAA